ncbi:hypothetical protein BGZ60DRAFT_528980 [Tricladium varicosporioides]|nr:hypothetical protein BGZ60DRAFT_528980 [Hymenoscyphus varicosporioides]
MPSCLPTRRTLLITLLYTSLFEALYLLLALTHRILTLPYLTPLALTLSAYHEPFRPIIGPFALGFTLKIYEHIPFRNDLHWICTVGFVAWLYVQCVVGDVVLWGIGEGEGNGVMGRRLCVEVVTMVVVGVAGWREWKWEFGILDWLVRRLGKDEIEDGLSVPKRRRSGRRSIPGRGLKRVDTEERLDGTPMSKRIYSIREDGKEKL